MSCDIGKATEGLENELGECGAIYNDIPYNMIKDSEGETSNSLNYFTFWVGYSY